MPLYDSGIFTKKEFQARGVTKLAPDVLVYIAGNQVTRVISPVSGGEQKISFNDGITSVNVQNNVDPPGSSTASIEVATPIYGDTSKYWISYQSHIDSSITVRHSIFLPMMEVKIFMKGRYLVKGVPRYYPIFWGLINSVDESYSGGVYKISIQCGDILSWLDKSVMNVHPVPESRIASGGGQKLTVYATIFEKANPYNIVYTMINKFFDIGKEESAELFVTPSWVGQKTNYRYNYPTRQLQLAMQELGNYWRSRFEKIGTNLKMYGMSGKQVNELGNILPFPRPPNSMKSEVGEVASGAKDEFDIDASLRGYIPLADYEKMASFETAEYQSKLQILTEVKNRIQFELYQDVNGGFIFKPPFYNMDISGVFPYTLYPNEILSCSFQTNSEGIITVLQTKTAMHKLLKETAMARGVGFHMDIDLAAKYGIRFQEIAVEYTTDASIARSLAVGELSKVNAKCYTGNITVPGRPEMKLGYPIYLMHRDTYHYVKSISHQFDYGGSCSTTLSLEAERRIRLADDGNELGGNRKYVFKKLTDKQIEQIDKDQDAIKKQEIESKSGRTVGLRAGQYEIKYGPSLYPTDDSIPITDSKGYQLIGAFPYGRNIDPLTGEVSDFSTLFKVSDIEPSMSAAGESAKIGKLFPPDENEEWSVPRYLDSAIIDTNPANTEPSDIEPGDLMDSELQTSPNLIANAYKQS
jgi:hypothetical protein